jgi:hypothetical protein
MPHPNAYELPRRHAVLARRVAAIVELRRGVQERCIVFSYQVARPEEIVGAIDIAKSSGAAALNVLAAPLMFNTGRPSWKGLRLWVCLR